MSEQGNIEIFALGLIMIIIYIIDSSFPIFYFLFIILGLYFYNKNFPIFQLILIIICVYLLFYMVKSIMTVMKYGCGKHRAALMVERFTTDDYFNKLNKRVIELDKKFDTSITKIENIQENFNNLKKNICFVLTQVDDGLEGNYASNVPDDETALPLEDQRNRAADRKLKAKKYVADLKNKYSEKTKIIECFDDNVPASKQTLMDNLELLHNKFNFLTDNLNSLKKNISEEQIAMYNVSLGYNEKYLQKLAQAVTNKEGFIVDPVSQIEILEADYEPIIFEISEIQKTIDKFTDIIKNQMFAIKQAKGPVTDSKIRYDTINASYNENSKPKG